MDIKNNLKIYESLKIGDLINCNRKELNVTFTQEPGSYVDLYNIDGSEILSFLVLDKCKMYAEANKPITWLCGATTCINREIFFGWVRLRHLISCEDD